MTYRERQLARADRLRGYANKRTQSAAAAIATGDKYRGDYTFNTQPGHIPERARLNARQDKAFESIAKADGMTSRAAEIERQADNAIYSDDVDAVDRLTDKIAILEAQRARVKVVNALIRKRGLAAVGDQLTEAERTELLTLIRLTPYHKIEERGFPAYHLTNLGGNINRLKKRLADLGGRSPIAFDPTTTGATATARAGLVVASGKQPRTVWTVRGNVAFWRPLLTQLGGSWYRGAFSFWGDPAAAIETACADYEADEALKRKDGGQQ